MAIYAVTIIGRKSRVLVKAGSQAEARDLFVSAKALTAEGMQEALDDGERVWKPGVPLPDDSTAAPEADEPDGPADDNTGT